MVLKPDAILARLKELDQILLELDKYRDLAWDKFMESLSQRWIIERGLMAAAAMIFDVSNQILGGHFAQYPGSYESSLEMLHNAQVLPSELYEQMRGLGGFRNILAHGYLEIDPRLVYENLEKGLRVFPRYGQVILAWLDEQERSTND
jgi:uncharacterized protein YutE (UPF0331/DUF86 family)